MMQFVLAAVVDYSVLQPVSLVDRMRVYFALEREFLIQELKCLSHVELHGWQDLF